MASSLEFMKELWKAGLKLFIFAMTKKLLAHSIALVDIMLFAFPLMLLSGCLILPLPIGVGQVLEGEEVTAEQLRFLLDPMTRQEDVVEKLGQPRLIWEDQRVYAYHWRVSDGKLFWFVGGGYSGIGGVSQLSSADVLLIQFNEIGEIIRLDRLPMPKFNDYEKMLRNWVSQPITEDLTLPEELLKD